MAIAICVMAFLVASVELVLPSLVATEAFAMPVTDKSAATFQIPVGVVARMLSATIAVVEQVPEQQLTPRCRFSTKDPRIGAPCSARLGQEQFAKEAQQNCHVFGAS